MPNETHTSPFIILVLLILSVLAFILAQGNTLAIASFEKKISEESLSAGLYYSTQALPCLSRNLNALDETRRFVLDEALLDAEIEDYGRISCASYGGVKYRLSIYDLDRKEKQWTFKNYQPLGEDKFLPRYGQIILVDSGGALHRAFLSVEVDPPAEKAKGIQLWMFCNSTAKSEPADFSLIFDTLPDDNKGRGVEDAYYYKTSNCETENCVKGPGQAIPTCQPPSCKYAKAGGDPCINDCDCKSASCSQSTGQCVDRNQRPLIAGQPCKKNIDCNSGLVCAYDKRCRIKIDAGIDISPFKFP